MKTRAVSRHVVLGLSMVGAAFNAGLLERSGAPAHRLTKLDFDRGAERSTLDEKSKSSRWRNLSVPVRPSAWPLEFQGAVTGCGPAHRSLITVRSSFLLRPLDRSAALLARIWPGLFAYQFVVEATRLDDAYDILD